MDILTVVKNRLNKYKPRNRKLIDRQRMHEMILQDLNKYLESINYVSLNGRFYNPEGDFISCGPNKVDELICFCNEKRTINTTHFHVTNVQCKRAKVCFCINCDTLEITEHKLGECPHAKYIYKD